MKSKKMRIDGGSLDARALTAFVKSGTGLLDIPDGVIKKISHVHADLLKQIKNKPVYGVNTGFGPMADRLLPGSEVTKLQYNLIRSHAAGAGEPLPKEFVLGAMVVRLNTLLQGASAVTPGLIKHYANCINKRLVPVVYEHGAVGTSGDLVQLSHIALGLIGEGYVYGKGGGAQLTSVAMRALGLKPYELKPKEGLSLINGTAMMTSVGAFVVSGVENILKLSVNNASLALELVRGYTDSLHPKLHALRPHTGQIQVAKLMRARLQGSKLLRNRHSVSTAMNTISIQQLPEAVQQVYSIRCSPQILGPLHDTLAETKTVINREMNSVTDNPVYDRESRRFLHGGNFHGDYVAVAVDKLKIPLAKAVLLSERRLNFFLNDHVNGAFTPFLNLRQPGLDLALQGLQFVATSTAACAQTYAYPHTVHSISTNGDNQDLVSMGTDAALFAYKMLEQAYIVLAIESIALAQAVDVSGVGKQLSVAGLQYYKFIRTHVAKVDEDRSLQPDLARLIKAMKISN